MTEQTPDQTTAEPARLWSQLLALPPACSILASISVVWTLGPVGDWLLLYWLPVTRWIWEVTLGRLLWFPLTPEQKDILTLTALSSLSTGSLATNQSSPVCK